MKYLNQQFNEKLFNFIYIVYYNQKDKYYIDEYIFELLRNKNYNDVKNYILENNHNDIYFRFRYWLIQNKNYLLCNKKLFLSKFNIFNIIYGKNINFNIIINKTTKIKIKPRNTKIINIFLKRNIRKFL